MMRTLRRMAVALTPMAVLVSCVRPPTAADPGGEQVLRQRLPAPSRLKAIGHRFRIDLDWSTWEVDATAFRVWGSPAEEGPYTCVADQYGLTVYSDFIGGNGVTRHYRVEALGPTVDGQSRPLPGAPSLTVHGTSVAEDTDAFLTGIQAAGIRYFTAYAHPESGLAREWGRTRPNARVRRTCALGATGMGLLNIIVAVDRGILAREDACTLLLTQLRFLETADHYDGVSPHWLDGTTGKTVVFGGIPGGDVVETAFLMQGLIAVREYFTGKNVTEAEIRERADGLWRRVRWDRLVAPGHRLYWHWPIEGRAHPMRITGSNEGHLAYLLAAASPTHPVPAAVYHEGWVGSHVVIDRTFHGVPLEVGRPHGFPLFWTHYSYLGFDPRGITDHHVGDYFTHHRNVARIHWEYAQANPGGFESYGPLRWGLTASMGPDGYRAWTPVREDTGTIAPTAALSSFPYTPEKSLAMLEDLYAERGHDLWGAFGFFDAFNDSRNWVATDAWIGIDVGPIAPMIENHRTGLCWRLFMQAPEIRDAVERLGIRRQ